MVDSSSRQTRERPSAESSRWSPRGGAASRSWLSPSAPTSCPRRSSRGDVLAAVFMHNASDRARAVRPQWTAAEHHRAAVGRLDSGLAGHPSDRELLMGFTAFTYPSQPWRIDPPTKSLTPFGVAAAPIDSSPVRDPPGLVPVGGRRTNLDVPGAPPAICRGTATGRCC